MTFQGPVSSLTRHMKTRCRLGMCGNLQNAPKSSKTGSGPPIPTKCIKEAAVPTFEYNGPIMQVYANNKHVKRGQKGHKMYINIAYINEIFEI